MPLSYFTSFLSAIWHILAVIKTFVKWIAYHQAVLDAIAHTAVGNIPDLKTGISYRLMSYRRRPFKRSDTDKI